MSGLDSLRHGPRRLALALLLGFFLVLQAFVVAAADQGPNPVGVVTAALTQNRLGLVTRGALPQVSCDGCPGMASSIDVRVVALDPETGRVVVNGGDTRQPETPFSFDWSDGHSQAGFFPQVHVFTDRSRDHWVVVTAHYSPGITGQASARIPFTAPAPADPYPTQVVSGGGHSCALLSDGTARCWGSNSNGQLGDGTTADRLTPVAVTGLADVRQLAAGLQHTCALLLDRTVRCWGANLAGQVGDGTTQQRAVPTAVSGLSGVSSLAVSLDHTCAIVGAGEVRCWGRNAYGQLGDGTTTNRAIPVGVPGLAGVTSVAAGAGHTCAVLASGAVSCWGQNAHGQLGDGTTTDRGAPGPVVGLSNAVRVSLAGDQSCAVLADGTLTCWGRNGNGQLARDPITERVDYPSPVPVALTGAVEGLAPGGRHTCAVLLGGVPQCWGYNAFGQLGDDGFVERSQPRVVLGLVAVLQMASGDWLPLGMGHVCALTFERRIYCWGDNSQGQLGDGTRIGHPRAAPVTGF